MNRRTFIALSTASTVGTKLFAAEPTRIDVLQWDKDRILRNGAKYLNEKPVTITATKAERSTGGLHDYFSEGDYWWPDPKNPNGPYIRRDGYSNPDNFVAHRDALIRLSLIVPALTVAWRLTGEAKYANAAIAHLRAWFVTPETRMNPNLEHAQAIHGVTPGRGIGIIDTLHLVEVARATSFLAVSPLMKEEDGAAVHKWFADYLTWMAESKNGMMERDEKNNHGTCWTLQAAEFARFTGNDKVTSLCRELFQRRLIRQMAIDGSYPLELARTKPYSYSLFNLDVMSMTCEVLSTPLQSMWEYELPDGRGMRAAVAFHYPFIKDKRKWPYKADVEYFADLPVRQPSLLFAARAYTRPEYLATWKTLNPDPTVPEIIRNFPIRQPALWTVRPPA
ncbi:MAG: alginate lyase family protein [Acidobacteria bacterium]|nr:alginate lyase family protein [Acidobacteriota bacterium]